MRIKNLSSNQPADVDHADGDAVERFTAALDRKRHSSSSVKIRGIKYS
jgi:hypothetical protein